MEKDFTGWLPVKQKIDAKPKRAIFFEREIWWCNLGINVGYEQDGKGVTATRPVLILKKFNAKLFCGFALSTKLKEENPYYMKIIFAGAERSVLLHQMRTLDGKRLVSKIGTLSEGKFEKVKEKYREILF